MPVKIWNTFQLNDCEIYTSLRALSHVPRRLLISTPQSRLSLPIQERMRANIGFDDPTFVRDDDFA